MEGPLLSYTNELYEVLELIKDEIADALLSVEGEYFNNYQNIDIVGISENDFSFEVEINKNKQDIKCGKFIRYVFPGTYSDKQIFEFVQKYNDVKNSYLNKDKVVPTSTSTPKKSNNYYGWDKYKPVVPKPPAGSVKVDVPEFKFNPKDVRSTFLSLTTKTYPMGHEDEVAEYVKPIGLTKDEFGNYYKIIGNSESMFTSHLDTADRKQLPVTVFSYKENGDEIFVTDGTSILGADDKSGVAVMMYMIAHNIPGVYYFFMGEERGGIGSNKVSSEFDKITHLKGIKRCISFDRRNYHSVITEQLGRKCCSDKFGSALAAELNKNGLKVSLDPTGIYTDSASFIDDIPECTNVSVGYFNEHTVSEKQNISFLERLAKACVNIKWEELPTIRKVGFDEEIIRKYKNFLNELKSSVFNSEVKLVSEDGNIFVRVEIDDPDIENIHNDILSLSVLLNKYKLDPNIYFDYQYMKIKLD
jgi:hypothetical protein